MKRLALSSVAVAALLLLNVEGANAADVWGRLDSPWSHYHDHGPRDRYAYRGGSGLRHVQLRQVQLRQFGSRYTPRRAPHWHDTTHLHWHPGEWQWCNGRRIYVPGHYDVHQTGHWHH